MRVKYKEYNDFDLVVFANGKLHKREHCPEATRTNGLFNSEILNKAVHTTCNELFLNTSQVVTEFIPSGARIFYYTNGEHGIRLE